MVGVVACQPFGRWLVLRGGFSCSESRHTKPVSFTGDDDSIPLSGRDATRVTSRTIPRSNGTDRILVLSSRAVRQRQRPGVSARHPTSWLGDVDNRLGEGFGLPEAGYGHALQSAGANRSRELRGVGTRFRVRAPWRRSPA